MILFQWGRHSSQPPSHRVWLWVKEGLHSVPEGLYEEDCHLSRDQRQGGRGGHLQEEHQWLHEGCSGAVQGPSILRWRVHGQRRNDHDHGLQGLQGITKLFDLTFDFIHHHAHVQGEERPFMIAFKHGLEEEKV